MKTVYVTGFTIIETMLFLAISSLLVVGVLIGIGNSIGGQRYHDSITSLQSILQQQYSDVSNTGHSTSTWSCTIDASGNPKLVNTGSNVASGQSDCLVLGKYISSSDGQTINIKKVLGIALTSYFTDDIAAFSASKLTVTTVDSVDYKLEWGATLKKPNGGGVSNFSVLILRSPISGAVRTFIHPTSQVADDSIGSGNLLNVNNLGYSVTSCIKYDGSIGLDKTAIYISPNSASAGGIELWGSGVLKNGVGNGC